MASVVSMASIPCASSTSAVRPRDDLEIVAVEVVPVQAAAAVVTIDLECLLMPRVGPIRQAALTDAREDRVELLLAHQEGIVLDRHRLVAVLEIERHAVVERDLPERTEAHRSLAIEDL